VKKSIATGISMMLFIIIILGLMVGASVVFVSQVTGLVGKLPEYGLILQNQIVNQAELLQTKYDAIPTDIAADLVDKAKEYGPAVVQKATVFTGWVLGKFIDTLSSVSTFVINFIIAIILAYFLSVELETWKRLAKEKT